MTTVDWSRRIRGNYNTNFDQDYESLVALGYRNISITRKFGFYDNIRNRERTIWDGAGDSNANYLDVPSKLWVASSAPEDTEGGTGARRISIFGLDQNLMEQDETLDLAGETPVKTANTYLRCHRQIVEEAGDGGENAGKIAVFTGSASSGTPDDPEQVYSLITPGKNQTLQCNYTIPSDRVGFLRAVRLTSFGNNNAAATVRVIKRPAGGVWQTKDQLVITRGTVNVQDAEILEPGSDIEVRAERTNGSGNIDISAWMFMWLAPISTE